MKADLANTEKERELLRRHLLPALQLLGLQPSGQLSSSLGNTEMQALTNVRLASPPTSTNQTTVIRKDSPSPPPLAAGSAGWK